MFNSLLPTIPSNCASSSSRLHLCCCHGRLRHISCFFCGKLLSLNECGGSYANSDRQTDAQEVHCRATDDLGRHLPPDITPNARGTRNRSKADWHVSRVARPSSTSCSSTYENPSGVYYYQGLEVDHNMVPKQATDRTESRPQQRDKSHPTGRRQTATCTLHRQRMYFNHHVHHQRSPHATPHCSVISAESLKLVESTLNLPYAAKRGWLAPSLIGSHRFPIGATYSPPSHPVTTNTIQ